MRNQKWDDTLNDCVCVPGTVFNAGTGNCDYVPTGEIAWDTGITAAAVGPVVGYDSDGNAIYGDACTCSCTEWAADADGNPVCAAFGGGPTLGDDITWSYCGTFCVGFFVRRRWRANDCSE